MDNSSHEGTKMSEACGHLRSMHTGHEKPAAAGNKAVGVAKQPMSTIKAMGKAGRKDA